jgi:serine/threonine-protein kinase HipA
MTRRAVIRLDGQRVGLLEETVDGCRFTTDDGAYRLAPAYDLVSTRLVIPDDRLALPVAGNDRNVTRRQWLELAARCDLPPKVGAAVMQEVGSATDDAATLIEQSALPTSFREAYVALIRERRRVLAP